MKAICKVPLMGAILWGGLLASCTKYDADLFKYSYNEAAGTGSNTIPYQSSEEEESTNPFISQLSNSECKSHSSVPEIHSTRSDESVETTFEMTFEGSEAICTYTSLHYFCDYGKVNIMIDFKDDVLSIVEYPSGDIADCYCDVDASFTIKNIPDKEFTLKLFSADTSGNYREDCPVYSGVVDPHAGSIKISYGNAPMSTYPYPAELADTGCKDHGAEAEVATRGYDRDGSFEMVIDNTEAYCKFTGLEYPCDFEKVNIRIEYIEGTLIIVEYPSNDQANCICDVDATFSIKDIPQEDFTLKIYRGNTSGEYYEAKPV